MVKQIFFNNGLSWIVDEEMEILDTMIVTEIRGRKVWNYPAAFESAQTAPGQLALNFSFFCALWKEPKIYPNELPFAEADVSKQVAEKYHESVKKYREQASGLALPSSVGQNLYKRRS